MELPQPIDIVPLLMSGFWMTLILAAGGIALMLFMSFTAGLARISSIPPLRWLAVVYIEVFRGTSALVQLFWFFYVLPFFGLEPGPLFSGILVLGLNVGSYGAEVVRGSIVSIPKEQYEAAIACNFTPLQRLWKIVLPQAVPAMLPPFGNLFIELLKYTALVSTISLAELTYRGQLIISDTGRGLEVYIIIFIMYFILALAMTGVVRVMEHFAALMMGRKVAS